jgi:hypothetical protein
MSQIVVHEPGQIRIFGDGCSLSDISNVAEFGKKGAK